MKPSLFVGSSVESLPIAYAVHESLMKTAEVTVWADGLFELSKFSLEQLLESTKAFDFACFVFAPDDLTRLRGQEFQTARDNVVFEMGLFMGVLGRDRVLLLLPDKRPDFHLPSDLLGLTGAEWETGRRDGNLVAAVGPACNRLRRVTQRLGRRADATGPRSATPLSAPSQQPATVATVSLDRLAAEVRIMRALSPWAQALLRALEGYHLTPVQLHALKKTRLADALRELRSAGFLVSLGGVREHGRKGIVYWFPAARAPIVLEALASLDEPTPDIEDAVEEELESAGYKWAA